MLCNFELDCVNVVKVRGFLMEDGYPAIIMDWAPGGSLYDYMKTFGNYDKLQTVRIPKNLQSFHHPLFS